MSIWRWTVDSASSSIRADRALLQALDSGKGTWEGEPVHCSRSRLQALMDQGNVLSSGNSILPSDHLKVGSLIEIRIPPPTPVALVPENRPLDILYEDEFLAVINKPPGLTVHPSETQAEGTLVHALLHHIRDLSGIGGELRPGIVHRIDKDTSGALVISKTDEAHRRLSETFSKHAIERVYWAFCYGTPKTPSGKIETLIGRNPQDRKKMSADVKQGRHAVTHWKRLREYAVPHSRPFACWIEARLETGRTHQVRVHLTGLGHSLLGDPVYGVPSERASKWVALPSDVREVVESLPGQALHARVLGFEHPMTGKKLHFEAEPPAELRNLMASLSRYE